MNIRAFITHKKAEFFTDCQDRFSINSDTKSIALSDGMSQSIFQKYWAEILVDTYTSKSDWYPNIESVRELSTLWINKVNEVIEDQRLRGKSTWRVERSLTDGYSAGATFLGIRFEGSEWKCQVLGDSCLVWIQNNKIKDIISSEEGPSFSNYPDYYDSNPNKVGKGQLREESGRLLPGDVILLVSDPFSDFLLKKKGTNEEKDIVERLLSINTHNKFVQIVEEFRKIGMHNDDSTLVIIKFDGSEKFDVKCEDNLVQLINEEASRLNSTSSEEIDIICKTNSDNSIETLQANENLIGAKDDKRNEVEENSLQPYKEGLSIPDLIHIFDEDFGYSLEISIYNNLKGFILLKNKKKEITKTIAADIKKLIYHTIMKK